MLPCQYCFLRRQTCSVFPILVTFLFIAIRRIPPVFPYVQAYWKHLHITISVASWVYTVFRFNKLQLLKTPLKIWLLGGILCAHVRNESAHAVYGNIGLVEFCSQLDFPCLKSRSCVLRLLLTNLAIEYGILFKELTPGPFLPFCVMNQESIDSIS